MNEFPGPTFDADAVEPIPGPHYVTPPICNKCVSYIYHFVLRTSGAYQRIERKTLTRNKR